MVAPHLPAARSLHGSSGSRVAALSSLASNLTVGPQNRFRSYGLFREHPGAARRSFDYLGGRQARAWTSIGAFGAPKYRIR